MTVALAATYYPRGEIGRLKHYYSQMQAAYSHITISISSSATPEDAQIISELPGVEAFVNDDWTHGRYRALKAGYASGADTIHYCDMDRLIRWVETRPEEWLQTIGRMQEVDCLVIGRTPEAWATHPQVMIRVEKVINQVFSYLLGGEFDIGSGTKSFSRAAAAYILANSQPGDAIGTDAEWPVLLHRGGFQLDSVLVDGMDWEIPDQYQDQAADRARQEQVAAVYDQDVNHWMYRVGTTMEVIESGLKAFQRPLSEG